MKKIFITTIALFGILIFLNSCSEESSNTPTPPDNTTGNKYFPVTKDSWWKYSYYNLNEDGTPDTGTILNFQTVAMGEEEKEGKDAHIFQIQDLDGVKIQDNEYYHVTNTQIWSYTDLLPDLPFTLPINLTDDWFKIADEKGTEWQLYKESLKDVSFEFNGVNIILNDDVIIKMKNEGTENVTYGANLDKTVKARKYKMTLSYGGNSSVGPIPIQIPFSVESLFYYGENIGLVKLERKPFSVSTTGFGELYKSNGNVQILQDYSVKP